MLVRTATALVGLTVLLVGLWGGLPWVFLLTCLAAMLGVREFYRLHPPNASISTAGERVADAGADAGPDSGPVAAASNAAGVDADGLPDEQSTDEASLNPVGNVAACRAEDGPARYDSAEDRPAGRAEALPVASPENPATEQPPAPPSGSKEEDVSTPLPALIGVAWAAAFVIGGAGANSLLQFWAISLGVFLVGGFVAALWLIAFYHGPRWPVAAAYLFGGPLYVGFLLGHVMALAQVGVNFFMANPMAFDILKFPIDHYELGRNWLLFALLVTFATDTGAYLVGRALGRHPMAPTVSPNKTWEGAAGGFAGAVVAALLLERLLNLGLGLPAWTGVWTGSGPIDWAGGWNWQPLLIGATVGIASQGGDLLESRLKRLSQVKDAGSLMPGHGGILDRLDSLLITFPVVYYLLVAVLRL